MVSRTKKNARLPIEGPATIRNADSIHATLANHLKRHKDIEIDCSGITEADFSVVQILIAARKSAARDGKRLVLTEPVTGPLRDALSQSGLLPGIDGQPREHQAFWLNGSKA